MKNQTLIILIKELKEKKLVPSKKKTETLVNFTYPQIDLFLKLLRTGYIRQENINNVINNISRINIIACIDKNSLKTLYFDEEENKDAINDKVLNIILKNLIYSKRPIFVNKLASLKQHSSNTSAFYTSISNLDNTFLIRERVTETVIDFYFSLYKENKDISQNELVIEKLQEVLKNKMILKQIDSNQVETKKQNSYFDMLQSFSNILCNKNEEYYNEMYNLISSICNNKKIGIDNIIDIINNSYLLEKKDSSTLALLESILLTIDIDCYVNLPRFIRILNYYDQEKEDNANLAYLTKEIYRILKENKFSKYNQNGIYDDILYTIESSSTSSSNHDMKSIYELITELLKIKNFQKYLKESSYYSFIESSLLLNKENINDILEVASNRKDLPKEKYFEILNSFSEDSEIYQLETRLNILKEPEVMQEIKKDFEVFKILNNIINYPTGIVCKNEQQLLTSTSFLDSPFFHQEYFELLRGEENKIEGLSLEYLQKFFLVIKTFSLFNPKSKFYLKSILDIIEEPKELEALYKKRIKDATAGLDTIGNTLYKVLSTNNEELVDNYIKMLSNASNDIDFKADSMVFQKKQ